LKENEGESQTKPIDLPAYDTRPDCERCNVNYIRDNAYNNSLTYNT